MDNIGEKEKELILGYLGVDIIEAVAIKTWDDMNELIDLTLDKYKNAKTR